MEAPNDAFLQFLIKKRIDALQFKVADPARFARLLDLFENAGPIALDYAQKFHWNDLRAEFLLNENSMGKD